MKIILTGSLGNISKPLAEELIAIGHQVTVISSNAEKQTTIESMGAVPAIGSLKDDYFLTEVFSNADAVYTMVPPDFTAQDPLAHYFSIGNSYAKAINESGIKRVVNLSSWGAHLPKGTGIIEGSYHVEKIFAELADVSITHLRPTSFYYNMFHYMDMIKTSGIMGANFGGKDKVVMVSPLDIAAAAAEELVIIKKGIRYVASDERKCSEIASILGKAIGIPNLQWLTFSDQKVQDSMESHGVPLPIAIKLVELNSAIHNGLLREDYDLHPPQNMGKVKLEEFAKEFAFAYHQK
ncbi:NAD(P)H-binding protein [Mucilaginibacter gilvus]|uniref:NAD-dependent dehydratase n=1 Tax=Mucilaginibacter gilvus TaxID=2305909 RepID=A0A444MNM8_9SPHI|nr:NAD(P)H-binding protein [Mucilaginibacter gilvus]RWY51612.1 NAD-dependent dehydratase [Mucilaginibacter gilvus]